MTVLYSERQLGVVGGEGKKRVWNDLVAAVSMTKSE
jgi:hypothetical protein